MALGIINLIRRPRRRFANTPAPQPHDLLALLLGIVSLTRIIRWDVESTNPYNRSMTPEEIMDTLEKRVIRWLETQNVVHGHLQTFGN